MPMYKNYFFDLYGTLVDIRGADSIGMKSCREIQSLETLLKDC